ncbi:MAG: lactonase family protein [Kiritimatiellales bacterium]|nr:lactonase family protein [Kiritimatiellales bacterium]
MKTIYACTTAADTCQVYIGTMAQGDDAGIYLTFLDMQTGKLREPARVSSVNGAGFIALHPDGQHLYSASAATGLASAFRILKDGTLTKINSQTARGAGPCHVTIDPLGKNLLVANYHGGSCAVLPIRADRSLAPASAFQQHSGSSIHPTRQTEAHTHSINCDPAGRFAIVADLGIDQLMIYRFDADAGTLTPNDPPFVNIEPGGGPRHFTFHPNGKFAYADLELSNKAVVFEYDQTNGTLTEIQSISTLPDGYAKESITSEIRTTPDGRFLYVANRGHDSLAIFAIDAASGKLTALGYEPVRGENPRNFNIDPTGTFLIALNPKPGNAVVFRIDKKTGALEFTGSEISITLPGCAQFLAAP